MTNPWIKALGVELKVAKIIHDQAQTGWLFDVDKCKVFIGVLANTMDEIDERLKPMLPTYVKQFGVTVLEPFKMNGKPKKMVTDWGIEVEGPFTRIFYEDMNLGSDKQVKEFLLTIGWEPTWYNFRKKDSDLGKRGDRMSPKLSDSGNLCPNLDELDGDLGRDIATYLKNKHRRSLLEGLLKVVRPDGRIPAEANTLGAATHRMTHRKITCIPGPNAFFGPEIRSLFIAREGYSIVGVDSKSNQMRILAHYLKLNDKHPYARSILYGTKEDNSDAHCIARDMAGLAERFEGKTLNYSILFGSGDPSLAKKLGKTVAAVKRIKKKFFGNLPELPTLLKGVKHVIDTRGYLKGLDGRKIWLTQSYKALNYLLQSAEAVYMKYALVFLDEAIKKEGLDAKFVANIHDEFQLEVKDEDIERVSELCLWTMEYTGEYLNLNVPMAGDVNVGKTWAETH